MENLNVASSTANLALPASFRALAFSNQKGGVGKTTTAINVGTALAAINERVLIVDLDPQGNASTGLGIAPHARKCSIYDVLRQSMFLPDAVVRTSIPNLSIVPSTLDLLGFEVEHASAVDRAYRLRIALAGQTDFTYVLFDCPPSLNLLTINALAACSGVIVPLQCEFFALEGLGQMLKTVQEVRKTLNPDLKIEGIALTMYDSRNNLSEEVAQNVRSEMPDCVYETVIPRNVRISEAPSHGKPVLLYDVKCSGSQAYLRLASEIIRRARKA
jgi:chromosome partitioning protein